MAKILVMSDSPNIQTGMGRVHKEIAGGLKKRGHDIESLGWFSSMSSPNEMPWPVHATRNQYYGSDVFDDIVRKVQPDIVLTIGDIWMIDYIADKSKCGTRKRFRWVGYCPIDGAAHGEILPPTWIPTFRDMDVKVAYTEYGRRIILNSMPDLVDEIKLIPHGVDTSVFHPLPKEEIDALRRTVGMDTVKPNGEVVRRVCYLLVARNQFRKNIPEIAKAWKKFSCNGERDDITFWPHMMFQDPMGWNLDEIFDIMGIRKTMVFFDKVAHAEANHKLLPSEDLNRLYNVCDVFLLLSGEGWGLPIVEAMACGKPVIALDHSASTELVKGRGELVKVGGYVTGKRCTERPIPDQECLVRAMDRMFKNPERRLKYGRAAIDFIQNGQAGLYHGKGMSWDNACNQWDQLMKQIEHPLSSAIKMREVS